MTLNELMKELKTLQPEYGDHDVVVPIGMDCAVAQMVELVRFNPLNGATRNVRADIGAPAKCVVYVSPSQEPRD